LQLGQHQSPVGPAVTRSEPWMSSYWRTAADIVVLVFDAGSDDALARFRESSQTWGRLQLDADVLEFGVELERMHAPSRPMPSCSSRRRGCAGRAGTSVDPDQAGSSARRRGGRD
jgi:hypothetical protein